MAKSSSHKTIYEPLSYLTYYISLQVKHVTCSVCHKYFNCPETAACGHSMCHLCAKDCRVCPVCSTPLDRRALKFNKPLLFLTEHVHALKDAFTQESDIQSSEIPSNFYAAIKKNATKDTSNWLADSQNHFTPQLSEESNCLQNDTVTGGIVPNRNNIRKSSSPVKVVQKMSLQEEWDIIEEYSENEMKKTNELISKSDKITVPDKEVLVDNKNKYSLENPRRSSRKRKPSTKPCDEYGPDIENEKSTACNKNSKKPKENWKSFKRINTEFNRLSKQDNKLDVSIVDCKEIRNTSPIVSTHNILQTIQDKSNKIQEQSEREKTLEFTHDKISKHQTEKGPATVEDRLRISNKKDEILVPTEIPSLEGEKEVTRKETMLTDTLKIKKVNKTIPFIKKSLLSPKSAVDSSYINIKKQKPQEVQECDDIEISIKVGTVVTNIVIKKKENDMQFKVMSDKEVQTNLKNQDSTQAEASFTVKNITTPHVDSCISTENKDNLNINTNNTANIMANNKINNNEICGKNATKQQEIQKNTASLETLTANFPTASSTEKRIANNSAITPTVEERDRVVNVEKVEKTLIKKAINSVSSKRNQELDIFDTESVSNTEGVVLKHAISETLCTTVARKSFREDLEKRQAEESENSLPKSKKVKLTSRNIIETEEVNSSDSADTEYTINFVQNPQDMNYSKTKIGIPDEISQSQNININKKKSIHLEKNQNECQQIAEVQRKCEDSINEEILQIKSHMEHTTPSGRKGKKPNTRLSNSKKQTKQSEVEKMQEESDSSVVEETPEKNVSLLKIKQRSNVSKNSSIKETTKQSNLKDRDLIIGSEVKKSKTAQSTSKLSMETPLSIDNFVESITYKSTPLARKSLNFENNLENIEDMDQTPCPTSIHVASTTLEKELMMKAFEESQDCQKSVQAKGGRRHLCIAGSMLSPIQLAKLQTFCKHHNWTYQDKYTPNLTHLVVSVDDENKSQRTVKYMSALAASKWIVTYSWVEKSLAANRVLNEEYFEALDHTGEPAPMRSRTAKTKLFVGYTFFAMPPFNDLGGDSLELILKSAGACVVGSLQEIHVTVNTRGPHILLAEPQDTQQQDKFIYLAMQSSVVPVNHEWVYNCLGSYTVLPLQDFLLCPAYVLPPHVSTWPPSLMKEEDD